MSTTSLEIKGLNDFLNSRKDFVVTNSNFFRTEQTIATLKNSSYKKILKMLGVDLNSALSYLNLVLLQYQDLSPKKRDKRRRKSTRKSTEKKATSTFTIEINPMYEKIVNLKQSYTILYPAKYNSQEDVITNSNELKDSSFRRVLKMMNCNWEDAFNYMAITVVNYLYEEIKRNSQVTRKRDKKKRRKTIQEVDIDPNFKKLLEFIKIFSITSANKHDREGLYVPKVSIQRIIRMLGIHWYYIVEYLQVSITLFTDWQSYQRSRINNLNRKARNNYEDGDEYKVHIFSKEMSSSKWRACNKMNPTEIFDMIQTKTLGRKRNSFMKRVRFDQDSRLIPIESISDEEYESEEERMAKVKTFFSPIFDEIAKREDEKVAEITNDSIIYILDSMLKEITKLEHEAFEKEKHAISSDITNEVIKATIEEISRREKKAINQISSYVMNVLMLSVFSEISEIERIAYDHEKSKVSLHMMEKILTSTFKEITLREIEAYNIEKTEVVLNVTFEMIKTVFEEIDKKENALYEEEKEEISKSLINEILCRTSEEIIIRYDDKKGEIIGAGACKCCTIF